MSVSDTHSDDLEGDGETLRSRQVWKAAAEHDLDFDSQRLRNSLRAKMFGVAASPVSIGRFKVLETVGSGGMGVVYAAYDEELDRRVAVKLLHSAPEDGDSVGKSRLLREAQALAKATHPNVVQVYEVGTFGGRVFVAMEFLRGPTMREWLLDEPRPWSEVLGHFVEAGEGLAAAHREGIIHRDFKPANLLFGSDGRIRVVDFGLARADGPGFTTEEASEPPSDGHGHAFAVELTQTGEIMGTPAYMSPEQARQEGVDARSDQYSFCVALYEGLFGQRPHVGRSSAEVIVAVAEGKVQPPPRGSKVPARIVRAVMRGLSVDPEHRFPSMEALLTELSLERHGRWRWLGVGAAAAAAALMAFVPGASSSCPDFEDALDDAWSSHRRAALQSAFVATGVPEAEVTARSVGDKLDAYAERWLDARQDACEAHQVRREQSAQLHDLRVACLLERRVELDTLAQAFADADAPLVARSPQAVIELEEPSACSDVHRVMRRMSDDPAHQGLRLLLAEARAQTIAGRYDVALAAVGEVLRRATEDGTAVAVRAEAEYERSIIQERRRVPAIETLESAVALAEEAGRDELGARAWMTLARHQAWQGDYVGAGRSLRFAHSKVRRLDDDDALSRGWLESRAVVAWHERRYDSAIDDQAEVVSRLRRSEAEPLRLAEAIKRLADFHSDAGRHDDARDAYEEVRSLYEAELGRDHSRLAELELELAIHLIREGREDEARERFVEVEGKLERSLGPEAPALLTVNKTLADLAAVAGELDEAERRARRTLELWTSVEGAPLGHRLDALALLGMVASERKDHATASEHYRSYLELVESSTIQDEYRDNAVYTRVGLAESLAALGRHDEAAAEARRALSIIGDDERFAVLEPVAKGLLSPPQDTVAVLDHDGSRGPS